MNAGIERTKKNIEDQEIFTEEKNNEIWIRLLLYSPCLIFLTVLYFMLTDTDLISYLLFSVLMFSSYVPLAHMVKQGCRNLFQTCLYIVGTISIFFLMAFFMESFPEMRSFTSDSVELSVVVFPFLILGWFIYFTWKEHRRNGIKRNQVLKKKGLRLSCKKRKRKNPSVETAHERTFSKREPKKFGRIRKRLLIAGLPVILITALSLPYIFDIYTDINYLVGCVIIMIFYICGICLIRPRSSYS